MSYVDAYFDRDADIIRVVERNEGKRKKGNRQLHLHEHRLVQI